jgi:hypothetical protein
LRPRTINKKSRDPWRSEAGPGRHTRSDALPFPRWEAWPFPATPCSSARHSSRLRTGESESRCSMFIEALITMDAPSSGSHLTTKGMDLSTGFGTGRRISHDSKRSPRASLPGHPHTPVQAPMSLRAVPTDENAPAGTGLQLETRSSKRLSAPHLATMRIWMLMRSKTRCMPRCSKKRLDP